MRTPVILVAALALSGCLGGGDPVEGASADGAGLGLPDVQVLGPVIDKNATVDAPVWVKGDAWTIESYGVGASRSTLVVAHADGSSYQFATTSDDLAMFDAIFDISYIGRIRASDLAGHQQDQPIQFFQFPLADGKTWSTTWDGNEVALRAGFVPAIDSPAGKLPGFVIQGSTADGSTYVTYDYVPSLRWLSRMEFAEGYGFKVVGSTTNWTGEVKSAQSKALLQLGSETPAASVPAGAFTVDPDQFAVVMMTAGFTEAQLRATAVVAPDNTEHAGPYVTGSPTPSGEFEVVMLPPIAGQWKVVSPEAHKPGGFFSMAFHQVAVTVTKV